MTFKFVFAVFNLVQRLSRQRSRVIYTLNTITIDSIYSRKMFPYKRACKRTQINIKYLRTLAAHRPHFYCFNRPPQLNLDVLTTFQHVDALIQIRKIWVNGPHLFRSN